MFAISYFEYYISFKLILNSYTNIKLELALLIINLLILTHLKNSIDALQ